MISQDTITAIRDGRGVPSIAAELLEAYEGLVEALRWITRPEGAYSVDSAEFRSNIIEACMETATLALEKYGIENFT